MYISQELRVESDVMLQPTVMLLSSPESLIRHQRTYYSDQYPLYYSKFRLKAFNHDWPWLVVRQPVGFQPRDICLSLS